MVMTVKFIAIAIVTDFFLHSNCLLVWMLMVGGIEATFLEYFFPNRESTLHNPRLYDKSNKVYF